jgi:hypothetical protein
VECTTGGQESVNRLVWGSGYTQVVKNTTRGDVLLDVYLVWTENLFTSCSVIEGVSDHCRVLLKVEWVKILSAGSRKASTGVPQSRCHGATNISPG